MQTTNHPEKLDPALIRPGRINKKIYMGRICLNEALCMIRHYFHADGQIPAHVVERLRAVFVDEALSPAELETMCADHDTSEEIVDQLVARFTGVVRAPVVPELPPAVIEALAAAEDEPTEFEASVKADLEALRLREAQEQEEALALAAQATEDEASASPTSVAAAQAEEEEEAPTIATAAQTEEGSDEEVESETEGLVVRQTLDELEQGLTTASIRLSSNMTAAPVTSCHVALSPIVLSPMLSPANSIATC